VPAGPFFDVDADADAVGTCGAGVTGGVDIALAVVPETALLVERMVPDVLVQNSLNACAPDAPQPR